MTMNTPPEQLNVQALASMGGEISGRLDRASSGAALDTCFERLAAESCVPNGLSRVAWHAQAEVRHLPDGSLSVWLHLDVSADVPLVCQRCMTPVMTTLSSERWFRFVADESTAEAEDEHSDEDVLVLVPKFNLAALVEDELLMALPFVPMHDACPVPVVTSVTDQAFSDLPDERRHPFADLKAKMNRAGGG